MTSTDDRGIRASLRIVQWTVPAYGTLCIQVAADLLMARDFYRKEDNDGRWGWWVLSADGKPTAAAGTINWPLLDALVADHPVVGRLLDQFGYDPDESGRDDSDPVQGGGPCGACGHDPACGLASVYHDGREVWFCHTDSHSCYAPSGRAP